MAIETLFSGGVRFPRLGVVRLGTKEQRMSKEGKPYFQPIECDYFVLPPELREAFKAQGLPERPKSLDVAFPSDDPRVIFPMWFTRYDGPLLAVRCDGVEALWLSKDGAEERTACRFAQGENRCACKARALGRLNVLIRQSPTMGCYQVLIGGFSRNRDLMTELLMNQQALEVAGSRLSRAWFTLERVPATAQVRKDGGERLARSTYPVHLRLNYSPGALMGNMAPVGPLALPQGHEGPLSAQSAGIEARTWQTGLTATRPEPKIDLSRSGEPQGAIPTPQDEPTGSPPPPEAQEDAWDYSLCLARAVEVLQVTPLEFTAYTTAVYGGPEEMDETMLDDLREALTIAGRNPEAARTFKQSIALTLKKRGAAR